MNIGIIGSGMIGATSAQFFARAGHNVALAYSRGPAALVHLVAQFGLRARAATVDEAAGWREVVLLAIPSKGFTTLPAQTLSGKIVLDAMNYYPRRGGSPQPISGQMMSRRIDPRNAGRAWSCLGQPWPLDSRQPPEFSSVSSAP